MREKTLKILEFDKVLNLIQEYAGSRIGKERVLNLKPSTAILKIKDAHKKLSDALEVGGEFGYPEFSTLEDIRGEIHKAMIGGMLSISTLYDCKNLIELSGEIKKFYKDADLNNSITEMVDILYTNEALFKELDQAIYDRETLSDNASKKLKSLIRKKTSLNDDINAKLKEFVSSSVNSKYLQDAIVTLREGRYVIPVKREYKNFVKGIVHDVSGSGGTYFIEPQKIVNMNNEIRVVENEINEEKLRIIKDLSKKVGAESEFLKYNIEILAELDFIFAKAKFGKENGYSKPIFNDDFNIKLRNVFHPLIDSEKVVKTDVDIDSGTKALIITGPNTGGKTVIIKTVGIISLLAQSGCMIPADESSTIPIFKEIFTDIGDEQSIEQSLSTFSSHMINIVDILKQDPDEALYLFDELGAGTDPTEGAALAMSIIDILKENKIKLVASTHYAELKVYALNTPHVLNGSMQFNIESLRPTYKLVLGIPGKSNAFEISKKLGLDDLYINKAKSFVDDTTLQFESVLEEIEATREKISGYKEEHEALLSDAEKIRKRADEYYNKEKEKADKLYEKARKESKEIYDKAKADYEDIIKDANKIINNIDKSSARKIQETRDKLRENINKLSEDKTKKRVKKVKKDELIPGQSVRIVSLDQIGEIITLPNENGDLQVQVGILKVNSNINDIELTENATKKNIERKKYRIEKSKYIKTEIDLRGVDSEELYDKLDKYIDDAFIAGLKEITIVHGKGTGILRKATEELLKKNSHVESFRLGKVGEGDTGVTVVNLK